jgi:hypothetical protein
MRDRIPIDEFASQLRDVTVRLRVALDGRVGPPYAVRSFVFDALPGRPHISDGVFDYGDTQFRALHVTGSELCALLVRALTPCGSQQVS